MFFFIIIKIVYEYVKNTIIWSKNKITPTILD